MTPASASTATIHSPAIPRTRLNALRLIMVAAILIFGAWASMRYSFGAWAPDADIAGPVVVWEGVSHYGLGFLVSWHYTQDNWLFSLLPLTSVIFTLFGTNPKLVVGVGWLIFMASVGTTSFLVYRIAGRRAAIPVAVISAIPQFLGHRTRWVPILSHHPQHFDGLGSSRSGAGPPCRRAHVTDQHRGHWYVCLCRRRV